MTSDPDFASENIIARDCLMASHVRDQATRLGLSTITIDGAEPIDKVARMVIELADAIQWEPTEASSFRQHQVAWSNVSIH